MVKRGKGICPVYLVEWATEKGGPRRTEEVNAYSIKEAKDHIKRTRLNAVVRSAKRIR